MLLVTQLFNVLGESNFSANRLTSGLSVLYYKCTRTLFFGDVLIDLLTSMANFTYVTETST